MLITVAIQDDIGMLSRGGLHCDLGVNTIAGLSIYDPDAIFVFPQEIAGAGIAMLIRPYGKLRLDDPWLAYRLEMKPLGEHPLGGNRRKGRTSLLALNVSVDRIMDFVADSRIRMRLEGYGLEFTNECLPAVRMLMKPVRKLVDIIDRILGHKLAVVPGEKSLVEHLHDVRNRGLRAIRGFDLFGFIGPSRCRLRSYRRMTVEPSEVSIVRSQGSCHGIMSFGSLGVFTFNCKALRFRLVAVIAQYL